MLRSVQFVCMGLCLLGSFIQCAQAQKVQVQLAHPDTLLVRVMDDGTFRVDRLDGKFLVGGRGPLNAADTKRQIEKYRKGRSSLTIILTNGDPTITRKEVEAFANTLRDDWKVLEGLDRSGLEVVMSQSAARNKPNKPGTGKRKLKLNIDGPPQLTVIGHIEPISFSLAKFYEKWDALKNLRVAEQKKEYSINTFRSFLPHEPVSIGAIWNLNENVVDLLKQLHPKATLNVHIDQGDSKGRWATLRAYNDQLVDIVFRMHGEFVLQDGYFTPSQFSGRLVLDRKSGEIVHFKLFVPNFTLNFDANWRWKPGTPGWGITDTGYCNMELTFGREPEFERILWSEEVRLETALHNLAVQFYPAWNINWVSMEDALQMARRLNKPLHIVSADGPFKDEAC